MTPETVRAEASSGTEMTLPELLQYVKDEIDQKLDVNDKRMQELLEKIMMQKLLQEKEKNGRS